MEIPDVIYGAENIANALKKKLDELLCKQNGIEEDCMLLPGSIDFSTPKFIHKSTVAFAQIRNISTNSARKECDVAIYSRENDGYKKYWSGHLELNSKELQMIILLNEIRKIQDELGMFQLLLANGYTLCPKGSTDGISVDGRYWEYLKNEK